MRFLLNSANVVPMNHGSMEKNHAMKKERHKELLDDDFDDYDNDDYYERYFLYLYTITCNVEKVLLM